MSEEETFEVPLVWIGVEDVPVLAVNQILAQVIGKEEFLLAFGQVAPPILLGTDEQKREQAGLVTFAQVKPVDALV